MRLRLMIAIPSVLLLVVAMRARAQDTLSDAAWNADRARRAAARQALQARRDSLARLVDTIVAQPTQLTLTVGDSVDARAFYDRVRWTGLRAGLRDTVSGFSTVLVLQPNPYLVWRNDYFVALKPGVAELWAWPGRPGATLRPTTGPRTIVPVTIR